MIVDVSDNFDEFKKLYPALASLKPENMIKDGLSAPFFSVTRMPTPASAWPPPASRSASWATRCRCWPPNSAAPRANRASRKALHAVEQEGVVPDLMIVAKGLGGGYQHIGASLAHECVIAPLRDGSGMFQHGRTYLGHPTACAAALAVQLVIARENLIAKVRTRGTQLKIALQERLGEHKHIGDIRGRGLFVCVELVQDRRSKAPFDPGKKLHARIKARAFANGLLCYPMGGTIDGQHGDHVLLAPPFIVSEAEVRTIIERLATSIDEALAE